MSDRPRDSQRIAVALSGGVDSAVVAALLKEQGCDVFAVTMRLQDGDDAHEAAVLAQVLGVPHEVIDLRESFARDVMLPFADTYLSGATPVPCARCNRLIKFGALMDVAKTRGAQALATGHYARRLIGPNGSVQLHRGADAVKDQSYFLFGLSQQQLDFARFPLGDVCKDETRRIACAHNLPVAQKKDSQDICFVPCGDYSTVLQKLRPDAVVAGAIVDMHGKVLGHHKGIVHFTVGQRKGLDLSDRKGDHNEPLFVVRLDAQRHEVVVGPREALAQKTVLLHEVNWLADPVPSEGMSVTVRLRSAQQPQDARLYPVEGNPESLRLELDQPAYGVAKGQAGVIYGGSRVLGGGWIEGRA